MSRTPTAPVNGGAIRAMREAQGYSLAAFARAVGVAHSHLSHIERGEKEPSRRVAHRIARALAVPTAALLRDDTEGAA